MIDRLFHRRGPHRWRRTARAAAETELDPLRRRRTRARQLRTQLNRLLHAVEGRLALTQIDANAFPKPYGSDWSWRPELWRGSLPIAGLSSVETKSMFGTEVALFHDCPCRNSPSANAATPTKTTPRPTGSPWTSSSSTARSFLWRSISPPRGGWAHPQPPDPGHRGHRDGKTDEDHGTTQCQTWAQQRVEKAWFDLIFEATGMNRVPIRDPTIPRLPRAGF